MRAASIFIILLSFFAIDVFAQIIRPNPDGGGGGLPNSRNTNDTTSRKKRELGNLLDTTQMVYGPHTTVYFTPKDWLHETGKKLNPDTLLRNFHHYNYIEQNSYQMQDLSAIASPSHEMYYRQPGQIGARLGITALDYLVPKPYDMPFYNTRSPYTYWKYIQGGGGRSILDIAFSRNVNERVNVGFIYRRIISRPLVGLRTLGGGDRQNDHQNITLHTNYTSKNGKYRALSYFTSHRTIMDETGGLMYDEEVQNLDTLFSLAEGLLVNRLDNASGQVKGSQWYAYHSYKPFDSLGVSLFHEWQWENTEHLYEDTNISQSTSSNIGELDDLRLYPNEPLFSATSTSHSVQMQQLDTRAGLKLRSKGFFAAAYYRLRLTQLSHTTVDEQRVSQAVPTEHFLGGMAEWKLNELFDLKASGEYLLFKNYRFNATLDNEWLTIAVRQQLTRPSLVQSFYYDNFFNWNNNDFKDVFSTELRGSIHLNIGKKLKISPTVRLVNISDYIYFDEQAKPVQASEGVNIVQPGVVANLSFGKWKMELEGYYTANTQERLLPMPEVLANAQVYYENIFFKGRLPIQLGIDFHWHSDYYAYAYLPSLRQFYLQQQFLVGNYPLASAFANIRINRARLFGKVTNLLQGFAKNGYYLTPGYMAQPRQFEFGVIWLFFD